jgi:hypothetical protein
VSADGVMVSFFNAFAANDPDSSLMIWRMLRDEAYLAEQRFVLINSRPDRKERSQQLAHLVATSISSEIDKVIVMGEPTDAVVRLLQGHGLDSTKIVDVGNAKPEQVLKIILESTHTQSSVVAIGNMGGQGAALVDLFEERSGEVCG